MSESSWFLQIIFLTDTKDQFLPSKAQCGLARATPSDVTHRPSGNPRQSTGKELYQLEE